jgi:hypothetical protein
MTIDPFATASRLAKTAVDNTAVNAVNQLNMEAVLRDAAGLGLAGLGIGAGARGLTGLYNTTARRKKNPYPGAMLTSVPIPVEAGAMGKAGMVDSYQNHWSYAPTLAVAGGLGLYGGWKGVDALLSKRRQDANEQDVEDARQDFERSLVESYPKARKPHGVTSIDAGKLAGDQQDTALQLGSALDALYDKLQEKQASGLASWNFGGLADPNMTQRVAQLYLLYGLGSGGLAGKAMYDAETKQSGPKVLQKAIDRRNRRMYSQRPSEVMAMPKPVPVSENFMSPGGGADRDMQAEADPSEKSLLGHVRNSIGDLFH